jgi:outer membrane protein
MIRKFAGFALLFSFAAMAQTMENLQSRSDAVIKANLQTKTSADFEGLPPAPVTQTGTAPTNAPNRSAPPTKPSPTAPSSLPPVAPQYSAQMMPSSPAQTMPGAPGTAAAKTLTIKDAEQLALRDNPQISAARLMALVSEQVTRETRSALWPTAVADFTGVNSNDRRIAAGSLNNPVIYERAAMGATVSQLITDFGRTANLVSSANLNAKAENENAIATAEQIRLATDQAFYNALQAHSVTTVAQQTVNARQTVADQIQALYKSKLKSELDLSFANVNLAQAKLLLLDAQNNENASYATLAAVLGFANLQNFQLVEDTSSLTSPPMNIDDLISQAFSNRPELLALRYQYQSARKFQTAERDLLFPTIRALGAIGDVPAGNPAVAPYSYAFGNWYGAVGANIEIPIFNGFLYSARAREADLRAQASNERLREMRDRISRDVRTSWLNANTAYNRLAVAQQLLEQSNLALNLAQTRYQLGLSSIVELSQAQLQQTQAEIGSAQAGYDYRLARAVLRFEIAATP